MTEMDAETRALVAEKEFRLCRDSFKHFFQTQWKIELPAQGTYGLPEIRPEQLETADVFQVETRVVVLKARQIGWSTIVTAYLFWKAYFHANQTCLVFSKKEDPDALQILANLRFGYESLPNWLRDKGPDLVRLTQTKIEFANRSTVESDAPSDNPARGRTAQLLILDEFGAFPDPENAFGSVQPAVEFGQFFVIGNADRMHSRFHRLYADAKKGVNNFKSLFYSWTVVPGRTEEWRQLQGTTLTPAQLASQYPNDDEECWVAAGSPVFDPNVVKSKPFHVGETWRLEDGHLVEDMKGPLRVWHRPMPNMRYGIGVDCAAGLEYGDDSVAVVMDAYHRVCAVLQGKIGSRELARQVDALGRFYNNALVGVERNNMGAAVIDFLRDEQRYPNLYFRRDLLAVQGQIPKQWGWHTSDESKNLMIGYLSGKLPEIQVVDSKVLTQLGEYHYVYSRDGRKVQMTGSPHDDLVIGLALAAQMVRDIKLPQGFTEGPPPPQLPPSRFEGFDGTMHSLARMDLKDEDDFTMPNYAIPGGRRRSSRRRF